MHTVLPHTKSNDMGEYRFERVDGGEIRGLRGRRPILQYQHWARGQRNVHEVKITPDHPIAEFTVNLPPRAGFLRIHLTDEKQGR